MTLNGKTALYCFVLLYRLQTYFYDHFDYTFFMLVSFIYFLLLRKTFLRRSTVALFEVYLVLKSEFGNDFH